MSAVDSLQENRTSQFQTVQFLQNYTTFETLLNRVVDSSIYNPPVTSNQLYKCEPITIYSSPTFKFHN